MAGTSCPPSPGAVHGTMSEPAVDTGAGLPGQATFQSLAVVPMVLQSCPPRQMAIVAFHAERGRVCGVKAAE
jgi:hypothetical protein